MVSRLRQVWGPLYAIALVAGGEWPQRCVSAFKVMALDASEQPVLSASQMILRDTAKLFSGTEADRLFARDIALHLRSMAEVDLYQDLSDRGLARAMTDALGDTQSMDIGTQRARGYHAAPIVNEWARLEARLDPPDDEVDLEEEFDDFFDVTEITDEPIEKEDENTPQPAETQPSRKSRITGTSAQDLSKEEPEDSIIVPPCEQDEPVVITSRRRQAKVQTAAGQFDDKYTFAKLKEK